MAVQALTRFFRHDTIKRVLALAVFLGGLVLLRHLATLLVFALIFAHGFGFGAERLSRVTPLSARAWAGILLLLFFGGLVGAGWAGVHKSLPAVGKAVKTAKEQAKNYKRHQLYKLIERSHIDPEKYAEQLKHYSHRLTKGLKSTGRVLLHVVLGLILAVLYLFERDEVDGVLRRPPPTSFLGYLLSFYGFLSEAVVLTVKVQVIVAAVNAVVTLPVILFLKLPHAVALMVMVFVFGLIPVVGNFLSGIVLAILSYLKMGIPGVAIFLVSTSVLHKIESYYLNPRLTAKHVALPKLLLVVSLIVWEHLIGFAGLFVSFPALYVGLRIRDHFRELNAAADAEDAVAQEASETSQTSETSDTNAGEKAEKGHEA